MYGTQHKMCMYGAEGNKAQAAALESVMIGGAKRILGCSSRTCNEAVRGDMGLDSLQGRKDKAKLNKVYSVIGRIILLQKQLS